jgi:hypothetical protein
MEPIRISFGETEVTARKWYALPLFPVVILVVLIAQALDVSFDD